MAKNDTILIDSILKEKSAQNIPTLSLGEAFEHFVFEQVFKDYDLSSDDIDDGWVDGSDDGGIDGFYIFVNGAPLLEDSNGILLPRSNCVLDVWVLTCKHHDTFKQAPLDSLISTVNELLDFSIQNGDLKGMYSSLILRKREILHEVYGKLSLRLAQFNLHFLYASRGSCDDLGLQISARADQLKRIAEELFSKISVSFDFLGARELVSLSRKLKKSLFELPFVESLVKEQRYVLLCRLQDFYKFSINEEGNLRRYLFDSNVRDFLGLNGVNEDIKNTLIDNDSPDFWWLNNGITILADSANIVGKKINLEGVQIVNGLQTTQSIVEYFSAGGADTAERSVLVKIIVSKDLTLRDTIIRASNNQSPIVLSSLRATDKVQRDIEDILLQFGFYYERRTNFYKNQGCLLSHIVTPLQIAKGCLNLVLKSPSRALGLKSKFMRNQLQYDQIFSSEINIGIWPVIAKILRETEDFLEQIRTDNDWSIDRCIKECRYIFSFLLVSRIFKTFMFNQSELLTLNFGALDHDLLKSMWDFIYRRYEPGRKKLIPSNPLYFAIFKDAATEYSIKDLDHFLARPSPFKKTYQCSLDFLNQVDALLPSQPWRKGIHYEISKKIECQPWLISEAIRELILAHRRYNQIDGVVYDFDNKVIDPSDPRILKPVDEIPH